MSNSAERISSTEFFSLYSMFCIGSTIIMPKAGMAGHDSWISVSIGLVVGLLLTRLFVALGQFANGSSPIELSRQLLGKWVAGLIGFLYFWYSLHLGTLVLKNIEEMTKTVLLRQTPSLCIDLVLMLFVVWAVLEGVEVLSRCSILIVGIVSFFIVFSMLMLIKDMDINNLRPIADVGWHKILRAGVKIGVFPFGETVLLVMLYPFINQAKETKKTTLWAVVFAGMMLLADDLRNVLVFGDLSRNIQFPSYSSLSFISVRDFLERIEAIGFLVWVFSSFVKIGVCLYVCAVTLSQTVGSRNVMKSYRIYTIPIAILMVELNHFIYQNQAEMIVFAAKVWTWYSLPFCLFLPLLLLGVHRLKKKKSDF